MSKGIGVTALTEGVLGVLRGVFRRLSGRGQGEQVVGGRSLASEVAHSRTLTLRRGFTGLLAVFLVTGTFATALDAAAGIADAATLPTCTTARTLTNCTTTLTVTPPAGLAVQHNGLNPLAAFHTSPTTFHPTDPMGTTAATVSPSGTITGITLPTVFYHESPSQINTGSTETIIVSQLTPGAATGSISTTGAVTVDASLQILVTIHLPLVFKCVTRPTVVLKSTGPYDQTTQKVSLSDSTFAIPDFSSTTCGIPTSQLNSRFAGPTGNTLSFGIQGALPEPPPPAAATTTALAVSPTGKAVTGETVTMTATVSSTTTSGTLSAAATVTFMSGSTALPGGTKSVVHGVATLTTSSLATLANQRLTAVYSGNGTYATSTSPPVTYVVVPKPTITASLPQTVSGGTSTPTPFTLTVANSPSGLSYPNAILFIDLTNLRGVGTTNVRLQYQDANGTWCTLLGYTQTGTVSGFFAGAYASCTPTSPASFAVPPGATVQAHFRIWYPTVGLYGTQKVTAYLYTGSCTGAGTCTTSVAPFTFTSTAEPRASGTIAVLSPSPIASQVEDSATHKATVPVHKTFNVALASSVGPATPGTTLPSPTGTVTYAIDGTTVATSALSGGAASTNTPTVLYNTSGLSVGRHTLVSSYSGNQFYQPSILTETFTVTAPPIGQLVSCAVSGPGGTTVPAYMVASGSVSAPFVFATQPVTVPVRNVSVTLTADPSKFASLYNASQTAGTLKFLPTGASSVTAKKITFSGTTNNQSAVVGTWTTTTTATSKPITVHVPVAEGTAPGTTITIGAQSVAFHSSLFQWTCAPTSATPAPITAVVVAGTTLSASPAGPITSGASVALTASVYPVPTSNGGTVAFDQTGVYVGTASVGSGMAALTVTPPVGQHAYTATWSGTLSVPQNTSNTVDITSAVAPVVTAQPTTPSANQGDPLVFTASATGTPVPSVTWQQSTDGGSTWATASGTTSNAVVGTKVTSTFTIPSAAKADASTQFRAVFTNALSTAPTDAVTPIVVIPPTVTTQPANQTVPNGSTATFTAEASGSVVSVQWQVSTDGGGSWSNAPGTPKTTYPTSGTGVTSTYTTPPTGTANDGNQYRVHFSNGAGTATSGAATLSVTATPPPPPVTPPVTPTTTTIPVSPSGGYHLVASNGSVFSFGNAPFYGSMGGQTLNQPIVGTATTPGDGGYWLVASDGGIFSFGNATFYGSMGGKPLNQPIVGIASTPDGKGYWEVASDGGIFAFGDASFDGSMGGQPLNKPIVGIAATPDGKGYWEVASDGGIFAFGDATFNGSTGSLSLNKPIVGMASTNNGQGYWLVASDGGVFSFGNAGFHGTVAGTTSAQVVSLVPTADNGGYWETAANGQVFQFGDATSAGTALTQTATIVAMSD